MGRARAKARFASTKASRSPQSSRTGMGARAWVRRKTSWRSKSTSSSNASGGWAGRLVHRAALSATTAPTRAGPSSLASSRRRSPPWTTPEGASGPAYPVWSATNGKKSSRPSPRCRSRCGGRATSGCRRPRRPRRARCGRRGPACACPRTRRPRSRPFRGAPPLWAAAPRRGRAGRGASESPSLASCCCGETRRASRRRAAGRVSRRRPGLRSLPAREHRSAGDCPHGATLSRSPPAGGTGRRRLPAGRRRGDEVSEHLALVDVEPAAAEPPAHVRGVALEELEAPRVPDDVDDLRPVDEDQPLAVEQGRCRARGRRAPSPCARTVNASRSCSKSSARRSGAGRAWASRGAAWPSSPMNSMSISRSLSWTG